MQVLVKMKHSDKEKYSYLSTAKKLSPNKTDRKSKFEFMEPSEKRYLIWILYLFYVHSCIPKKSNFLKIYFCTQQSLGT